jgi:hypothetical protein
MSYKILCTGNPNIPGISKNIKEIFPETKFVSRSSGFDLLSYEGIKKFKSVLPDYNIFINHSQLLPNGQRQLLDLTKQIWNNSGHVINIGSVLEFDQWSWIDPEAAEEKKKLKDLSLNLNSESFKTTHIIVGGLSTTNLDTMRLDPKEVATTIQWILQTKIHIPLIYVDNVSDQLTQEWLAKRDLF